MKRIKYKLTSDGDYESIKYITSSSGDLSVKYNLTAMSFSVINIATNEVLKRGTATSPHQLKKFIKSSLRLLGAELEPETRVKRKTTS